MISFSEDTANKTGFSARTVQQKRGSGTMGVLGLYKKRESPRINGVFGVYKKRVSPLFRHVKGIL